MSIVRINDGVTSTPSDELPTEAEWLEAKCRHYMAERAALPECYPHRQRRAQLLALIEGCYADLDRIAEDERAE